MIIGYLTVDEWKGRWARTPQTEKLLDAECVIHHVGGAAWMGGLVARGSAASRAAACKVFYDLNEYAINTKGYSFLDYDVLAWYDRFNDIGWIGDGRGQWLSAATLDRNEQSEAVCLAGNCQIREPLPQELELLAHAVVHGVRKGWISPNTVIYAHRDNPAHPGATQCCGQYLIPKLAPVVAPRVRALLNPPKVTMWNQPLSVTSTVKSAPPTEAILKGEADTWGVIACIKFVQKELGMEPTGVWTQAFGDAFNKAFGYRQ